MKPVDLKVIEGNRGRRKITQPDYGPESIPRCPDFLSPEAKTEWKRIVPELRKLGMLSKLDRGALAGYCQNYARWVQAEEIIEMEGMTTTTTSGYIMLHPAIGISNKALEKMRRFSTEFGMTPASRTRMPARKPAGILDPMAKLLNKSNKYE